MAWETGDPYDIFRRYGNTGQGSPFPTFGGMPIMPRNQYQAPPAPGVPRTPTPSPVGSAGPSGSVGAFGSLISSAGGAMPGATPRPPSENSMQRAQSEAEVQNEQASSGMRGISPQRRYHWATGRIDARPTQSPNNTAGQLIPNPKWDEFFGPNATHMGSKGTTWEERQQRNQQNVATVRELRGLSPY